MPPDGSAQPVVATVRLGWEFVAPDAPQPSPLINSEPMVQPPVITSAFQQPSPPLPWKTIVVVGAGCLLLSPLLSDYPALLLIPLLVVGAVLAPRLMATQRARTTAIDWETAQRQSMQRYHYEHAQWEHEIAAHEAAERRRIDAQPVWFPVALADGLSRLDVVGGTPTGWRSFIATMGSELLKDHPVLLVDFSGEPDGVASWLCELNGTTYGQQHVTIQSPVEIDVFKGLSGQALAEVLSEAVGSLRTGPDKAAEAADADLLWRVIKHLDKPVTAERISAALDVVSGESSRNEILSSAEIVALTDEVDFLRAGDAAADRLRLLRICVGYLAADQGTSHEPRIAVNAMLGDTALTVVRNAVPHGRRMKFLNQAIVSSLVRGLETSSRPGNEPVLVLAGVDEIRVTALEDLSRATRQSGIRLILLFEHLRDEMTRLVGGSDSATVFMRLGVGSEAAAAAEHIGREHVFTLSQISLQLGVTDTTGGGSQRSRTTGTSDGMTVGNTRSGLQQSASESTSFTTSISQTATDVSNWSRSLSRSEGFTQQRSYDFVVEPVHLQQLPPTAFILVEAARGKQRAVLGDCHPSITFAERVAQSPRAILPDRATWR
jgi:hypothetical protein